LRVYESADASAGIVRIANSLHDLARGEGNAATPASAPNPGVVMNG
jgi:hypothetical protein